MKYSETLWYIGIGIGIRKIDDSLLFIFPFCIITFDIDL